MEKPSPIKSILILLIFGVVAILLIPGDVEPLGALRLPAFLLAVGLVGGPLWQSRQNPQMLLRAEHILAFAPVFWLLLDPIQATYPMPGFSTSHIRNTFIAIILFSLCGWVGAARPSASFVRRLPSAVFQDVGSNTYFVLGIVAFILAFLHFAIPSGFDLPLMFNSLLENRWSAPWARGKLGGWDAFMDHLAYFGYILPLLTVVLARRARWLDARTVIVGICALLITLFLAQGGGRRIIGVVIGSAIVFWFLTLRRVRFSSVAMFLALVIAVGMLLNSILEVRTKGLSETEFEQAEDEEEESLVFINVDDNFLRLTQIISIFPDYLPHTTWRYPLWVAARPVPRAIWPGKPIDAGFDLAEFIGARGVALSSSVVGELFVCGGFLTVALGGLLYGRIAALLDPLCSPQYGISGLLLYSAGLLMVFAGFRSMIELVLMSYMLIAWIILSYFRPASET